MPSPVNFILRPMPCRLPPVASVVTALKALSRQRPPLWPAHCLVCREPCLNPHGPDAAKTDRIIAGALCPACRSALPWNRSACARCALPMPSPTLACGRCLRRPPPLTETHAAFVYGPPLDRLLPRLKFHDDLAAGRLLAALMAEGLHEHMRETGAGADGAKALVRAPDAIVPLPLHRRRLRDRGYDQALELARPLAQHLSIPLRTDLLQRVHETSPQSRLNAHARRKNLRSAFVVQSTMTKRSSIALPAHVVLIDDVMTTGATLHAAADALLRAGVGRVDAWVCARVA